VRRGTSQCGAAPSACNGMIAALHSCASPSSFAEDNMSENNKTACHERLIEVKHLMRDLRHLQHQRSIACGVISMHRQLQFRPPSFMITWPAGIYWSAFFISPSCSVTSPFTFYAMEGHNSPTLSSSLVIIASHAFINASSARLIPHRLGGYMVYILTVFVLVHVCVFCMYKCTFMSFLYTYVCMYILCLYMYMCLYLRVSILFVCV
jgi:hypothetical protein